MIYLICFQLNWPISTIFDQFPHIGRRFNRFCSNYLDWRQIQILDFSIKILFIFVLEEIPIWFLHVIGFEVVVCKSYLVGCSWKLNPIRKVNIISWLLTCDKILQNVFSTQFCCFWLKFRLKTLYSQIFWEIKMF